MELNARTVAALTLPSGKSDLIVFDSKLIGFGFRLRAGADGRVRTSWVAQYRHAGATRRVRIGDAETVNPQDARKAAKEILSRAALGQDVQGEREDRRASGAVTFESAVADFLKSKADVRPKTFTELERYLTGRYFKALHKQPLDGITRKDVAACLVRIDQAVTATRARTTVSSLFSWAMKSGLVDQNPATNTPDRRAPASRERVLSDLELAAVWNAAGDDDYGKILKLLVLSGCRRAEIGGMCWSELNQDAGVWTIPAARCKNGRAHVLTLPPAAWRILEGIPRQLGRDFVFGTYGAAGYNSWGDAKALLDQKLGDSVAPWVVHDIRRSVATGMVNAGIMPHVIEAVLNHVSGHKAGVAGIYNRASYTKDIARALAVWAAHVDFDHHGQRAQDRPVPSSRGLIASS